MVNSEQERLIARPGYPSGLVQQIHPRLNNGEQVNKEKPDTGIGIAAAAGVKRTAPLRGDRDPASTLLALRTLI